jgi:hypothetical protein
MEYHIHRRHDGSRAILFDIPWRGLYVYDLQRAAGGGYSAHCLAGSRHPIFSYTLNGMINKIAEMHRNEA